MSTFSNFNIILWVRIFNFLILLLNVHHVLSRLGALCAICDVNEYKKCVQEFKVPMVLTLFDTLHALCNLLLVLPENLKQVCTGDQLVIIF